MTNLNVKPMNSDVTTHRLSAYPVVGDVMEILTALDTRMKKTAKKKHVKIGNLIVDKVNVFSNLGNVMEKMIVPQELMNKIVQILQQHMTIVNRLYSIAMPYEFGQKLGRKVCSQIRLQNYKNSPWQLTFLLGLKEK